MLAAALLAPGMGETVEILPAADAGEARRAVDSGQAAAALIIPADFSAAYAAPDGQAVIELYRDPANAIGAGIAQSMVEQVSRSALRNQDCRDERGEHNCRRAATRPPWVRRPQQYSTWAVNRSQQGRVW